MEKKQNLAQEILNILDTFSRDIVGTTLHQWDILALKNEIGIRLKTILEIKDETKEDTKSSS